MFDLSDVKEPIISDDEFYLMIDELLGNVAELNVEKDIDPDYFSTPWAVGSIGDV